jgi:hypothetical protein
MAWLCRRVPESLPLSLCSNGDLSVFFRRVRYPGRRSHVFRLPGRLLLFVGDEARGDAAFYFDPTSLLSFEQTLLSALRRLSLELAAIRAASRRQALRFTWHDFARRIDEAIARTAAENAGSHPS